MVLPDSHGISRVPRYSGTLSNEVNRVSLTGLSPSRAVLSRFLQLRVDFVTRRAKPRKSPTTPVLHAEPVWAVPRSLAATRRISVDLLS